MCAYADGCRWVNAFKDDISQGLKSASHPGANGWVIVDHQDRRGPRRWRVRVSVSAHERALTVCLQRTVVPVVSGALALTFAPGVLMSTELDKYRLVPTLTTTGQDTRVRRCCRRSGVRGGRLDPEIPLFVKRSSFCHEHKVRLDHADATGAPWPCLASLRSARGGEMNSQRQQGCSRPQSGRVESGSPRWLLRMVRAWIEKDVRRVLY